MATSNILTWEEYLEQFNAILSGAITAAPYDKEAYLNYVKLNRSRQDRWLKKLELNEALIHQVKGIDAPQTWYAITEPWCGDAAHNLPLFYLLSELNSNINFKIVLRDTPPFMIDDYLTNGGKSVPKIVVRNAKEEDLFTWGPRPKEAQELYLGFKKNNTPFEEQKIILQQWYNKNKGQDLQQEVLELLKTAEVAV
ncbi:Thioredoxin [Lishizhenia tianjinensis]|uniref:Thioredoxin n=1 Tax=Lishizhenia tianjinensis TaxID=477690 RepID=A0A1I6XQS2_9FLAO|nr:thioredoxin family protein [Lishizhenia tianjinensis]SFT40775.1 Thioredoxin [Lishizhenia tianjinensis]